MSEQPAGARRFPALLWIIIGAAVALILAWGAAEKGPPHWDDSWYLAAAVRLFDRFAQDGVAGYWRGFEHALGDKAPLITVLPFPFFCLIGRSVFVIYLANSLGCILLGAGIYAFCRKFFSERVSLLAVFFALSAPLLAGLSRLFLPEYWLTTLVVLSFAALAQWETTGRWRWLLWLGVLCGLGLLMKITFPAFVAPAIAVVLWRKHRKSVLRMAAGAVLIAAPLLLIAGSWYGHNWESVTRRSFQETYFVPAHPTERQSPPAMAAEYVSLIFNYGVSSVHVLAAGAGLAAWLAARRRGKVLGAAGAYVAAWVIALPVFALSENRDLRLIAPMVPAFAIATAAVFDCLLERLGRARSAAIAVVAAGAVAITLGNSLGVYGARDLRLGPWLIVASNQGYAFAPNPQRWPLGEVLERIAHRERLGPGSKLIVGLGADTWSFNTNNLELAAALLKYPIEFHTTAYTADTAQIRLIMSQTQYFLLKDGGTQQPPDRFRSGGRSADFLLNGPLFREAPPAIETPDGGRIRIFENASAGSDAFFPARQPATRPELEKIDVNFGNFLQVTGLRLSAENGVVTLRMRWRCLSPAPRPYRAFVHLLNEQDQIVGSLDHEILHGSPPVDEWQPGDEGYEARYVALRPALTRNLRLRFGIFDPETGQRAPAWASMLPLKDDFTAAVLDPSQPAASGYVFQMAPAPMAACDVEFPGGLRLAGYSVRRSRDVVWLRLRWLAPRRLSQKLRFFGHAVGDQRRDTPIVLSFDQDLNLDRLPPPRTGGPLELVQDILRDASKLGDAAKFIRAGVFDVAKPNDRVAVQSSSIGVDKVQKAVFLPLPEASGP